MVSPTERENGTGANMGDMKYEATSNFSSDSNGHPLPTEMTGKHEGWELQAMTGQNTFPQQQEQSSNAHIQNLSSKIKLLEEELIKCTAECRGLKEELDEAKTESETLKLELHMRNIDLERQSNESKRLEEELTRLARENSKTVKRLKLKLIRRDAAIEEKEKELAQFKAKGIYFRDPEGNSCLHLAAKSGDEQAVKELIQSGADVNAKNRKAETPIILAGASEQDGDVALKIIKYLMEHGADVFAADTTGQTFLHKFAARNCPPTPSQFHDISDYLTSKMLSAVFNIRDVGNGSTPLMLAAVHVNFHAETISLLRANRVDFTLMDKIGNSVVCYAAEGSNNKKLLSETAKLEEAIEAENEELVKLLVTLGADVNKTTGDSPTPLHCAAGLENKTSAINIIKFLIESGAAVDGKYCNKTFLHALLLEHLPITPKHLHDMVSFLDSRDLCHLFNTPGRSNNSTPFQNAVGKLEIERNTLSLLKKNNVDFNAVDSDGNSVLCYATLGRRTLRMISDLVDLGADINHLSKDNMSMLHKAAQWGNVELLKLFVDRRLDVNAQDKDGWTPLHHALQRPYHDVNVLKTIQILFKNGAKGDIVDNKGKSPLDHFNKLEVRYSYDVDEISACFSVGAKS